MYSPAAVHRALALVEAGHNLSQVSRMTGTSRAAIRAWSRGQLPGQTDRRRANGCFRCSPDARLFPRNTEHAYAYLLGLYLGDGNVSKHARAHRLRIHLDRAYPVIIAECEAAMSIVMPCNRVLVQQCKKGRVNEVSSYSRHWPCLLPQHGPGMKHTRRIVLEPWQREICDRHPHRLLRGLIHSDGCRALNTIRTPKKTYAYPRYEFSNRSDDIRAIFCEYCDKVGVEWRRMNQWTISVARRESVALMDSFIGPKR
jgi:hypothetical protein